jgi:hypothetical protein
MASPPAGRPWYASCSVMAREAAHAATRPRTDFVPPGTYTIAVWHEMLGSRERQVTVAPGETATVDFALQAVAPEKP